MAHDVSFTVPKRKLGTADIEFEVKEGGGDVWDSKSIKRIAGMVPERNNQWL